MGSGEGLPVCVTSGGGWSVRYEDRREKRSWRRSSPSQVAAYLRNPDLEDLEDDEDGE